jgi:uncharacterized membrane protein
VSWYEFLLFVHVAAAALWLGGGLFLQIYAISVRRGGDPRELGQFAARVGKLGDRIFIPAALTVVLAGIGLTIEGSWSWGTFWIVFALAAFAGSFLTGALVIGPTAKRIGAVGADSPEGQALTEKIFIVSRVDLAFMYAILFSMTVKPTGDDGWVILLGALVLIALTVVFLSPLRRPRETAAAAD